MSLNWLLLKDKVQLRSLPLQLHFYICQRCKCWSKKVKKYHQATNTHQSNTNSSQQQGGYKQGNIFIDKSGQNNANTTTSGYPYDALVFHNDWCGPRLPERVSVKKLDNVSNPMRDTDGFFQKFIFVLVWCIAVWWIYITTYLLYFISSYLCKYLTVLSKHIVLT